MRSVGQGPQLLLVVVFFINVIIIISACSDHGGLQG